MQFKDLTHADRLEMLQAVEYMGGTELLIKDNLYVFVCVDIIRGLDPDHGHVNCRELHCVARLKRNDLEDVVVAAHHFPYSTYGLAQLVYWAQELGERPWCASLDHTWFQLAMRYKKFCAMCTLRECVKAKSAM